MNKPRAYFFSLVLIIFAAQFGAAQMKSDPTGTWGGTMTTDAGPGGLEITLKRDAFQWKASMKFRLEGEEAAPAVRDLRISGAEISFAADLDRNLVKFAGRFSGDTLKGTLEAFQGDRKTLGGTFALTIAGQMPPLQPQQPQGGGQMADPNFNAKVDRPAYKKNGPKILFDEAHNNFHTSTGRYKPFADLIAGDGYQVVPNKQKFSSATLKGYRILVISNALGAARMNDAAASNAAFTEEESDAVRDWVRAGGSLLLIADHAPMGAANQSLGKRFDVDMSKMYTVDQQNHDTESGNPGFIVYTRESGRLADHPLTRGRNESERINKIITFTGQSLKGPAGSTAFLKLADTAFDAMPGQNKNPASAAGRAQGIAMKFGKGRVIVMGEAGMLSAQIAGPQKMPFGMNRPGIDNRQLALNIMHWLSGLLK
ncbi:MAG TPA: DUF4350 domain-containing protein [Pyrinomonadaceae bacterium]|nr:DUF4350 domain-containing protein [Pyrinomonadaceae bacterium]